MPYKDRALILRACRYVDEVIPETDWDQKVDDVRRLKIDLFAMGDDWAGKFDELSQYCEVIYLLRTEGVSTTGLKWVAANPVDD